jgi:hypothetical protein
VLLPVHRRRTRPPAERVARNGFAIAVLAMPALEGGGPWFLPAVRLSAPLGPKHGIDLEAGRILGGSNDYAEIRSFLAVQVRFARESPATAPESRYWIAGLRRLHMTKLDGQGAFVRRDPDTAPTIGHGWTQTFQSGLRALGELGFSGGRGYMVYMTVGAQWGPGTARAREQR